MSGHHQGRAGGVKTTKSHEEVERERRVRKVAEKVHKLMKLAEDQAGTPEGDSAAVQARRLMEAHALSEGDVSDTSDPFTKVQLRTGRSDWRRDLLHAVAEHCASRALFWRGGGVAFIYGRRSSVEIVEYLYEYLQAEISRRCDEHLELKQRVRARSWLDGTALTRMALGRSSYSRGELRTMRTNFCNGAAWEVVRRLKTMRESEERAAPGEYALVVKATAAADAYVRECLGGDPRAGRARVRTYSAAGAKAGREIQINPGVRAERDERRQIEHERSR